MELIITRDIYNLTVDYEVPIEFARNGYYGFEDKNITSKHFLALGRGVKDITLRLFPFGLETSFADISVEMGKEGFRPGLPHEILALGAAYPKLQLEFQIHALGSVYYDTLGNKGTIYLCGNDVGERQLKILWYEYQRKIDDRFIGVLL